MTSVNVRDVAALAGVSVGTVSNVLNRPEKVADATVERVQRAIAQLGFIRNDAARQLRAGHSNAIGLVILDVTNPFFTDVARGAQQHAATFGKSVILGSSDQQAALERSYLDLFEEQRVLGVLLSPVGPVTERLERLRSRGIPAVLVDRISPDSSSSSVSVDDIEGGTLAVSHLIDQGRTRIAFVGGPFGIRQVSDRASGAARAAAARGATLEVLTTDALSIDEGRRVAGVLLARTPATRPDAVFAANDLIAIGLLQTLFADQRVSVPGDISIIGYDDIGFAASAVVPLSSIRQPSELIGRTAIDLVLEEVAGGAPRAVVFQPELVVRASTA
ncbi:LacI family DNA-binding transcriptional regulator [Frondihabitans sp. VKM Ac-2883]|uniref:LacI family DNA-binding transcriptional regulator n=1 Tax=Frondihabitans sp. VKM Ac-2883 TaxID=2783823 RepID=UPI00188B1C9F|nr:LacI family DNA-binding transcriptional regulator [Frondihabitans sp. VKM Ac-2883]